MTIGRTIRLGALAGALLASANAASAQDSVEEQEARRALHAEQTRLAAQQMAEIEARRQGLAEEQAAREQTYREALAARDAEIAATQARAAEARAEWEAAVTACLAGDRTKCAQPEATTTAQ